MNKILTINKKTDTYWFQTGEITYQTGHISGITLQFLLRQANIWNAFVFDISKIKPAVMTRLYKKFFNGLGYTDDVDMFAEALRMNKAKEIK